MFVFFSPLTLYAKIDKGSTKEEVISAYGVPSGSMKSGKEEILTYPGGLIVLEGGIVKEIDSNFELQLKQREKENKYKNKQKSKGLVEHKGDWISKQKKKQILKKQSSRETIKIIKKGGKTIDLNDVLVSGKITIVDFYADWCGPCRQISPYLEEIAKNDSDIFLRKIDIVKWKTPVTKQYGIRSIPDVRVFDRKGRMIGKPSYNLNEIMHYIKQAK